MRLGVLLSAFLLVVGVAGLARSQAQSWVQVEAQPTLEQAEARARSYDSTFSNVAGFALGSGWYAIALGPYTAEQAAGALAQLRRERLIPADSFVADGGTFQSRFWPAASPTAAMPGPGAITQSGLDTAPPADATTQPAATPEETPEEARASEAALDSDARREVQTALQWEGFYASAIDGDFGPGTRAAMESWQAAKAHEATGILTTAQRAELLGAYHDEMAALGLQTVRDADAGIEIDLPTGMVAFKRYDPPFARYDEKDGSGVSVLLISEPGDQATLAGLYSIMQTLAIVPVTGAREIEGNEFDLSGQNDKVHSFTHAEVIGGNVKGYTLVWKPEDDQRIARVLAAMKSSFRSISDASLDATMVPVSAEQRRGLLAGLEIRRPVIARSGFFVDATGDVATTTEVLKECARISFGDDHEATVLARDDKLGLALLRPKSPLAPMAFALFQNASPRLGSEAAVAGFSYGGALISASLTFGRIEDLAGLDGDTSLRRLSLAALPGDAGGPVFDGSGAVLGMLLPRATDGARVLPKGVHFALDALAISGAAQAAGLTLTPSEARGGMAPEDLTAQAAKMTVLVSCWK